jgi:hypothetical protein
MELSGLKGRNLTNKKMMALATQEHDASYEHDMDSILKEATTVKHISKELKIKGVKGK